jgi:hypothetical protein
MKIKVRDMIIVDAFCLRFFAKLDVDISGKSFSG